MSDEVMQIPVVPLTQGCHEFYVGTANAKDLWDVVKINQRISDKEEGYQRALSVSRVRSISRYVNNGNPIAPSIVITLDDAQYDEKEQAVRFPRKPDAGWVIDGQHRLVGAAKAETDIDLSVVIFVGLGQKEQIQQFVVINKEAKGVPTSLYYDLLRHIPDRKPAEVAKERAASIATTLRDDEESPFHNKIVVTASPKAGEISLTNFVRKLAPLIQAGKGIFAEYTQPEQTKIVDNYFRALSQVYHSEMQRPKSKIWRTLGFGAFMNALPTAFSLCLREYGGFKVEYIVRAFEQISDFDFGAWDDIGSGNAAEIQAGKDIEEELRAAHIHDETDGGLSL